MLFKYSGNVWLHLHLLLIKTVKNLCTLNSLQFHLINSVTLRCYAGTNVMHNFTDFN